LEAEISNDVNSGDEDTEEIKNLKKTLEELRLEYRNLRYPDKRKYSATTALWKKEFICHLKRVR